jgi:type II secretory ATPase GspE/PulE/Tfp pilus assembly ATPase PilB-like protein
MVSPDNLNESNSPSDVHQRVLAQFQGDWAKRLNVEQMFTLIQGVLPLEACLYYQVLPLFLEGNRLHLGMVTPNDTSALEYVRRIVSYLNYSLVPRAITYDALQAALTGYLNCTRSASPPLKDSPNLFSYGHHRHSAHTHHGKVDQTMRPTLILDESDDVLDEFESTRMPDSVAPPPELPASPAPVPASSADYLIEQITVLQDEDSQNYPPVPNPDETGVSVSDSRSPTAAAPTTSVQPLPPLIETVPALKIQSNHLSSPIEVLATLPAPELLQELLARVLLGGIGRLYFECHAQSGRVLWSQDGVLQSVLDSLPLPVFMELIAELKQIAQVAPEPLSQVKHAEIEREYDRNRVLLRFRFMPNQYGEEATLQVLRGAALRFYQKQQLTTLKRDALGIAKQLQTKLSEIRDRAYAEPGLAGNKFDALPALNQLLQSIEEQFSDAEAKEPIE